MSTPPQSTSDEWNIPPTMRYIKRPSGPTLHFSNLSGLSGQRHAVFTRHGGVSPSPFDTLNVGFRLGDRSENVAFNIKVINNVIDSGHLLTMKQPHGDKIGIINRPDQLGSSKGFHADALITQIPRVALMVKQADCQGVILFDPKRRVIANVHCGWRGNRFNILASVVAKMERVFGSKPKDIFAGIGPSLGPCCGEFIDYKSLFPYKFRMFMVRENYFNFWEISAWQLRGAGLLHKHIEVAGLCTRCRSDLFFSYRRDRVTGRFASVVMLLPDS